MPTCDSVVVGQGNHVETSDHRFPNWFLTTSLEPLAHLPAAHLQAAAVRSAHGQFNLDQPLAVVELDCPLPVDADVYRYLVLTTSLDEVETALVETSNKGDAFNLPYPQVEQFSVDYLQKNLRVKAKGGKTWNFTDKNDNADALFVFHRDVEAARKKLADGYAKAQ